MTSYIFYPLLVGAVLIVMRMLSLPVKWIFKIIINAVIGTALLLGLSYIEPYTGISVGLNALTVSVSAVFGVPGIVLLLMIRWLLLM